MIFGGRWFSSMEDISTSNYLLVEAYGEKAQLAISYEEFVKLKIAADRFNQITQIEEVYGIAAESYIELETSLLSMAIDLMVGKYGRVESEFAWQDQQIKLNMKILNLLNAFRANYEQTLRICNSINANSSGIFKLVKDAFSKEFDESLEYRVIDALRNFSQHQALPLDILLFSSINQSKSHSKEGPSRRRVTVDIHVLLPKLITSDKINSSTRQEMKDLRFDRMDLKLLIRKYVSCVAKVNRIVREKSESFLKDSFLEVSGAFAKFEKHFSKDVSLLNLVICENSQLSSGPSVSKERYSQISNLREKYIALPDVARTYTSSELILHEESYQGSDPLIWIVE